MRVLIARHHASRLGGVESYVDTIAPALASRGHDVGVWCEQGQASEGDRDDRIRAWHNDADRAALDDVARWNPAIVFSQGLRSPDLEARLLDMAPAIVFAHSYLGTCISGSKTHAFPSPRPCTRTFGVPCLAIYYPRRCGGWSPVTAWAMYRRQDARLRSFAKYRRILVASRHMAAEYARHGLADKTRIVRLPVADESPASRSRRAPPWRLLYLGRLEWTKGPDLAVEAAARAATRLAAPVHLVIAGDGQMETDLRRTADRLAAAEPRVSFEFAGRLSVDARRSALLQTDMLVVPSRWPEPFGLVGNEAGVAGVPSVGFAVGGIPEWLADGVNGRLVSGPPQADPLARAVADVLGDATTLTRMGEGARARAITYSIDAHVRELEAVFDDVAGGGARR